MRNLWLLMAGVLLTLYSCKTAVNTGFSEIKEGIYYKIESFGGHERKVESGDMVLFTSSVFQGDEKGWSPSIESVIQCDTEAKGLKGLLNRFEKEDSISVRIAPRMLGYDFGTRLDTSLGYGSLRLRIKEIYSAAQWNSELEAVSELKRQIEGKSIAEFLAADQAEPSFEFIDGMYLRKLERGAKGPVPSQTEVMVIYDCYLLDGTLIYSQGTDPDAQLMYGRALKGTLIPGMEKIVLDMDLNDVIEVVMPSEFAYGKKGVKQVGIEPWTPLRFIIRLQFGEKVPA
jgi:FKBP-type peptidyl-prolyl cis-trans isomerase